MPSIVALIPARSGSKRIVGKNIRELAGRPLLAYTIAAARESGIFTRVIVSSDAEDYLTIAETYWAMGLPRPTEFATDGSPDIQWVQHAMDFSKDCDAFAILRPTSPFRSADTIHRAWASFLEDGADSFDSLRSITKPKNHPNKMWIRQGHYITPYAPFVVGGINPAPQPGHSVPTQLLPAVYAQPATIEIAWTKTLAKHKNISGNRIKGFYLDMPEAHDLNDEYDWLLAEAMLEKGIATLPDIPEIQRPVRRPKKEAAHA